MAKSLNITVNVDRADVNDYLKSSTDPRGEMTALSTLFARLASGTVSGKVIAAKNAAAAVRASGTVTFIYANLAANDTVTVAGVTFTCVDTGTPTAVQFKKVTDLATTVANFAAAVNANTTTKLYVSAAVTAAGVVTITAHQAGVIGNLIALAENSANATGIVVSAAALAGGAGGVSEAPTVYSRGQ
jgi:ethanolamine utilization microcompartment shell protein EutS